MKYINFEKEKIFPSKIICVGRNYVEHIKELNNEIPEEIVVFNKPNSAISDRLKLFNDKVRYEGEICFLIKNKTIQGIGFGLDLTKVNKQNSLKLKGLPWEKAKAFDNSAVFSDFIKFSERDIDKISMKLYINKTLVQESDYNLMIYKPLSIIKEISSFMSLENGDIIMTGTPKGVGYYTKKDRFLAKLYCDNKLILKKEFLCD